MTADKPESQEICFVPGGDYREELRRRAGRTPEAGPIVDADGRMVGEHAGAAAYTVGQRKGLGVALGEPRYVAHIDAPANLIQLGRREDLRTTTFGVDDVSFVSGTAPLATAPFRAQVRIRHRAALVASATIRPLDGDAQRPRRWAVETDEDVWAAAPGQACASTTATSVWAVAGSRSRKRPEAVGAPEVVAVG